MCSSPTKTFAKFIATKNFTNGADNAFVVKKYAETYDQVVVCAALFAYESLVWNQCTPPLRELASSFIFHLHVVRLHR